MLKRMLLGFAALLVLAVAGSAVFLTLNREPAGTAGVDGEKNALSRVLDEAFGGQPTVEFVCQLPVVGAAPCVLGDDVGTREVRLTFSAYELPEGTAAEALARRIATLAAARSSFASEADRTDVIFTDLGGGSSALVSMKYSFLGKDLKEDRPSPGTTAAPGPSGASQRRPSIGNVDAVPV